MKIIRKTNVFIKTKRKFIVGNESPPEFICCEECAEQMIAAQASADFFGVSSRKIYRLIDKDKIHFVETETNKIYVCPVSIKKILDLPESSA